MSKTQAIIELADDIARQISPDSIGFVEATSQALCVFGCGPVSFRDALSKKEYSISGMCQQCQDKVFGE